MQESLLNGNCAMALTGLTKKIEKEGEKNFSLGASGVQGRIMIRPYG